MPKSYSDQERAYITKRLKEEAAAGLLLRQELQKKLQGQKKATQENMFPGFLNAKKKETGFCKKCFFVFHLSEKEVLFFCLLCFFY